jgi:hypothetical protein
VRQPWDRQEGEGARAFRAFTLYRDAPPELRSLTRVAQEWSASGPESSLSRIKEWSRQHQWRARATAWDDELDRRKLETITLEAEALAKREADLVRAGLDRVAEGFDSAEMESVRFGELVRGLDTLVRLERSVFGSDAVSSVARQPEPAPPPTQKTASVLRILEEAGVITLPETSGEPPLEVVDEDEDE